MGETKKNNQLQYLYFIVSVIISIVSIVVIICSTYLFVQFLIRPHIQPKIFGVSPQIVMTNDMSGNKVGHIEKGDLVFIKKVPVEEIEVQDVIAYFLDGEVIVTRVKDINIDKYRVFSVQADNGGEEYSVNDNYVLGTINEKIPYVGNFIFFTQSTAGYIIFIGLPVLVLIVLMISEYVNKKRKNQKVETNNSKSISKPKVKSKSRKVVKLRETNNQNITNKENVKNDKT